MRLVDLDPRWFAEAGRHGQGVTFECPCCVGKPNGVRLAVAFGLPIDGGTPMDLRPASCWPALNPRPDGAPGPVTVPPGIHWARSGETFERLTLSPSIDASAAGHWHGFVQGGEIR